MLDDQEVSTILGKSVRSNADEDMGRIVDIIVSRDGQVRAAIIDFGGFLGIGTRKIPARLPWTLPATRCAWRRNTSAVSRWW